MQNKILRKGLVVGIIILFIGVNNVTGFNTQLKEIKKSNRDNYLYVGGSGPENYTTIKSAVDNATNGTTVFVYDDSAPYCENIEIDKSISLIGESKYTTIVDGNGTTIFRILADNVRIMDFYIQNSDARGMRIYSDFNNISNNIFYDVTEGLEFTNSNNNIVYRNTIKGVYHSYGIKLAPSENNIISENNLQNEYHVGISLSDGSSNNTISNNILNGSYYRGISIYSSNNMITKNYITRGGGQSGGSGGGIICDAGVNNFIKNEVSYCNMGMYITASSCNIKNNIIVNNYNHAILLLGDNNYISGNIINENKQRSVIIFGGSFNKVINNAFINNSNWDALILIGGSRNIIEKNNFIGNDGDAHFDTSWGNRWNKNYWDECIGGIYLINGFWEIYKPYIEDPVRTIYYFNVDLRPARKPYKIPDTSFIQGCGIE